ncbi:hypothetical protein SDC9_128966 [bioreactor metagenome]|uniref:Uncharacterized protein n=1 Tax=bioreactor metagenome TaxID=1076179 RepID=A0A645CYA9_9ZZZZ
MNEISTQQSMVLLKLHREISINSNDIGSIFGKDGHMEAVASLWELKEIHYIDGKFSDLCGNPGKPYEVQYNTIRLTETGKRYLKDNTNFLD